MPNAGFYATHRDAAAILDFALETMGCRVLDAYSEPDCELREYTASADVLAAYPEAAPPGAAPRAIHLALWRPDFGPEPSVRRIEFRPGAVAGHTHRYVAEGWGLVDLQISVVRAGRLSPSSLAANSEARALKWADTNTDRFEPVDVWHWPAIARALRQLQYHIGRRLAVGKRGSRPILHGAAAAVQAGITLAEA